MTSCELVLVVADVTVTVTPIFILDQSEEHNFWGKLLIGQPTSRAARQIERERESQYNPPRDEIILVVFMIILR